MIRKVLCYFLIFSFFLPLVSADISPIHSSFEVVESEWTLLMYFAGDNPRGFEFDKDLELWKSIGSSDSVNIVALIDGMDTGDTRYCYVGKGSIVDLEWDEAESDLGDGLTLKHFLNSSLSLFPAKKYALFVMSTHGSGWQGLGSDTSNTSGYDRLTLLDMEDYKCALDFIKNTYCSKIDVVAFDICVTSMMEVAYQLKNYCNVMIATQEHGFSDGAVSDEGVKLGWNYSYFMSNLLIHPELSVKEFSRTVVDSYTPGTYSFKIFDRFSVPRWFPILRCFSTIAAIDLEYINETSTALSNLSTYIIERFSDEKAEVHKARDEVREYGKLYRKFWFLPSRIYYLHLDTLGYNCFIDLYDFVEKIDFYSDDEIIHSLCDSLRQIEENLVIANNVLPLDSSHGISVYFPQYPCQYDVSVWREFTSDRFKDLGIGYDELDFSLDFSWDDFLCCYLNL
ncbi:MAG: clostripain-related cysteine peptidase [Candidatus Thermoplasmatota archaeon]|nr:clostripain-related cysteine peptidase [Candidatus Thermoplasmatota archaeon]